MASRRMHQAHEDMTIAIAIPLVIPLDIPFAGLALLEVLTIILARRGSLSLSLAARPPPSPSNCLCRLSGPGAPSRIVKWANHQWKGRPVPVALTADHRRIT